MRFLIPLFVAWSAVAQLPIVPFTVPLSSGVTDYTNLLYADYQTDTTASLSSAYVNGSIVFRWTNISLITGGNASFDLQKTDVTTYPYRTNNVTPTGQAALEFIGNNSSSVSTILKWGTSGSNQPNTVISCVRYISVDGTIYDTAAGGRENAGRNAGGYNMFAGSGFTVGTVISSNFMILTHVFNGANSYIRTNGVLVGTGNAGTQAMGTMQMGNDLTFVTPWKGQIAAWRIYAEVPSTNNLHAAEQNLATRYLGITLPSP